MAASTTPPVTLPPATVDPEPDPLSQKQDPRPSETHADNRMDLPDEDTDLSDGDTLADLSETASEFGAHNDEPRSTRNEKSQRREGYHHA